MAFAPNTLSKLPGLGLASVSGNFAPFYAAGSDAGRMSSSLPIPRFIDSTTAVNAFRIDSCVTNLLFPFVTNQAGFDTGIAVANTSRDPFGNALRPQSGPCTINYYGRNAARRSSASAAEVEYADRGRLNDGVCPLIGRQSRHLTDTWFPGISRHPVRIPVRSWIRFHHRRTDRFGTGGRRLPGTSFGRGHSGAWQH